MKFIFLLLGLALMPVQSLALKKNRIGGKGGGKGSNSPKGFDGVRIKDKVCINADSSSSSSSSTDNKKVKGMMKGDKENKESKGSKKGKKKDSSKVPDIDECTLSPKNEDVVLVVLNMATFLNNGGAAQLARSGIFPILSDEKINFGAGGDCFVSTFEIDATEFVIVGATLQGITIFTAGVMREYVLCPNQTYQVSLANPDFSIVGGVQPQLLVLNPNLKLSCDGCILEAAYPANEDLEKWSMVVTPAPESLPFPGFVPDPSGLVIEGLTFTQAPGSNSVSQAIFVVPDKIGLPVQIRDVEIRDMFDVQGIINLVARVTSQFEISGLTVKDTVSDFPIQSRPLPADDPDINISVYITNTTVTNFQVGSKELVRDLSNFASVFSISKDVKFGITNTCVKNISTPEDELMIFDFF